MHDALVADLHPPILGEYGQRSPIMPTDFLHHAQSAVADLQGDSNTLPLPIANHFVLKIQTQPFADPGYSLLTASHQFFSLIFRFVSQIATDLQLNRLIDHLKYRLTD